jgi:alkylation response protein AidB-like acyl-CoA dehydrogenase
MMNMPPLPFFDLTRLPGTTDEHRAIQQAMRRFTEQELEPNATAWDEAGEFPRELYRKAAEVGLLGLGYPVEYGGTPCDTVGKIVANVETCRTGVGGLHASLIEPHDHGVADHRGRTGPREDRRSCRRSSPGNGSARSRSPRPRAARTLHS